jgi:hypothetical protein
MRWMAFGAALLAAAVVQVPVARATVLVFTTTLSGANEVPANASPGTGTASVTIDDVADTMRVQVTFSGLLDQTSASHIHCCTAVPGTGNAGVATKTPSFPGFPLNVTSGTYDHLFSLLPATPTDTYNAAFVTAHGGTVAGAEAALIAGLKAGEAYLNIHSLPDFGSGEIRGFLQLTSVPEPSSLLLLAGAFCGMIPLVRRRNPGRRA